MVKALDEWITAYIALGSNLLNKDQNLRHAIDAINELHLVEVQKQSDFLRTKAQGFETDNDFLNAVVEVRTRLYPEELLGKLLAIEQEMGRVRNATGYTDRPIDLDIIAFADVVYQSKSLSLPHPEMHRRDFVLKPMCEIAPNWMHPRANKSALHLLSELG